MTVRLPIGGFILPQPMLGLGGLPASPIDAASLIVLASRPTDVSGALPSIGALPPEPPVPTPEPPVPVPAPPAPLVALFVPLLPAVFCPAAPDVVCPLVA